MRGLGMCSLLVWSFKCDEIMGRGKVQVGFRRMVFGVDLLVQTLFFGLGEILKGLK